MEKYIIILVLLASIYYIQNKLKEPEGFQNVPAQSLGGVDDTNAINTLAQISKQLMAGGITVPGNINIQADLVFENARSIIGKQRLHVGGEELLYILNKKGVMIGKEWGGNGDLQIQGNTNAAGNLRVGAALDVGTTLNVGAAISSKGNLNARTDGYNTRVGGIWTAPGVYAEGGANLEIGSGSGNIYVGAANMSARQNLWVTGAHRVGGVGMRIFTMQVGDDARAVVRDPAGRDYRWGEWVCCVQGVRMDLGGRSPGAINQFCFVHNDIWHLRSEIEYEGDGGWPIILAIPWGYFENAWPPPNGPGFLGGW
jgi:hypothetical protein